jgi:hypothetical protein
MELHWIYTPEINYVHAGLICFPGDGAYCEGGSVNKPRIVSDNSGNVHWKELIPG